MDARQAAAVLSALPVLACAAGCHDTWLDLRATPSSAWRKPLSIEPAAVQGTAPLTDFPVLVHLEADPDLVGASVDELDFTDLGSALSFELVSFDAATGDLLAWVRLPALVPAITTTFYLSRNLDGAPAAQDPPAVWTDARAVWHFDGDPASGTLTDTSSRGNDGAVEGAPGPISMEGLTGGALLFDGIDDLVRVGDPGDESLDFGTSESFTLSVMVLVTSSVGAYDMPFHKGGSSIGTVGFDLELGSNNWGGGIADTATYPSVGFGDESDFLGDWVFLALVVDRDADRLRSHVAGALVGETDISVIGTLASAREATIGGNPSGNNLFRGRLDEMWVVPHARTEGWLQTAWSNVSDPAAFLTVGPAETVESP